jgi:parvulin-like peptidyl-prolyl isomerase
VWQIFVAAPAGADASRTAAARAKAEAALASVRAGEPFDAVARRASEDRASAPRGGDLGWISLTSGQGTLRLQAAAIAAGETTGVLQDGAGLRIMRVTDRRPGQAHALFRKMKGREGFERWVNGRQAKAKIEKFL